MGKLLESVLFDHINVAVAFFDSDGLLIRTNTAWESLCKNTTDETIILTYDDLMEQLYLEPMRSSEVMHVMTTTCDTKTLQIRRRRIEQNDSTGIMVEIVDISGITKKVAHTDRVFSDAMWKIRSRISSVQNVLTLFTDYQNEGLDSESLQLLKKTRQEVWEMMRHTENLRYLSFVDTGAVNLKTQWASYSLKELVDGVCLDCSPMISAIEGEVTISVAIDESVCIVTDRQIFMKVISSLLFNAVEYNSGVISVVIKAEQDEERTIVSVTDNGWGIPDDEQAKVFTYSFRGSSAKKTSYSGAGVELYLARKLLMMISGDVHFVSREDKGSTFTVFLRKCNDDN